MTLMIEAREGALIFRSRDYFIELFGSRWRLPAWLAPGDTVVTHADFWIPPASKIRWASDECSNRRRNRPSSAGPGWFELTGHPPLWSVICFSSNTASGPWP